MNANASIFAVWVATANKFAKIGATLITVFSGRVHLDSIVLLLIHPKEG